MSNDRVYIVLKWNLSFLTLTSSWFPVLILLNVKVVFLDFCFLSLSVKISPRSSLRSVDYDRKNNRPLLPSPSFLRPLKSLFMWVVCSCRSIRSWSTDRRRVDRRDVTFQSLHYSSSLFEWLDLYMCSGVRFDSDFLLLVEGTQELSFLRVSLLESIRLFFSVVRSFLIVFSLTCLNFHLQSTFSQLIRFSLDSQVLSLYLFHLTRNSLFFSSSIFSISHSLTSLMTFD